MTTELIVNGEFTLSRKDTYGKRKKIISEPPIFTSRMEKREYYKSLNYFDIRNVIDVKGLLKDIQTNLHTYVSKVSEWIQNSPVKKLVVTGIFTVILGVCSTTANAAFIHEYTYQVKNGEKIEDVAAAHGVTAQEILDANGISTIDGKKILLPKVQDQTVTATKLNIRSQPSTASTIIGQYQKGDVVKVSYIENGWAAILLKGRVCFVSAEYLTFTKNDIPKGGQTTAYVIKKGDTFTKISKVLGISVSSIQKLNPTVNPTRLKIGQTIKIPDTTSANTNQIKITAHIAGIEPGGTFRFITSDGKTHVAKATGNMINELFHHQGKNITLTLEANRGQVLTLISFQ